MPDNVVKSQYPKYLSTWEYIITVATEDTSLDNLTISRASYDGGYISSVLARALDWVDYLPQGTVWIRSDIVQYQCDRMDHRLWSYRQCEICNMPTHNPEHLPRWWSSTVTIGTSSLSGLWAEYCSDKGLRAYSNIGTPGYERRRDISSWKPAATILHHVQVPKFAQAPGSFNEQNHWLYYQATRRLMTSDVLKEAGIKYGLQL